MRIPYTHIGINEMLAEAKNSVLKWQFLSSSEVKQKMVDILP